MSIFTTPARIIVTCSKRLAPFLESEIVELGFKPVRTFITGVELSGSVNDCIKLNLNLRCASQVLYSLKEFTCDGPDSLYDNLVRYPWEVLLEPDGYFSITSNATHFTVNNEMFVNVKVKDAIADRMRRETTRRPAEFGPTHLPDHGTRLYRTAPGALWFLERLNKIALIVPWLVGALNPTQPPVRTD